MGNSEDDTDVTTPGTEALPDLNPWRQVGWLFHDGDCVAIARDGGDGPPVGVRAK